MRHMRFLSAEMSVVTVWSPGFLCCLSGRPSNWRLGWQGLDTREGEFSCDRRLCLMAGLFSNSVSATHSFLSLFPLFHLLPMAICGSDIPPSLIEESTDRGGVISLCQVCCKEAFNFKMSPEPFRSWDSTSGHLGGALIQRGAGVLLLEGELFERGNRGQLCQPAKCVGAAVTSQSS